MSDSQGSLPVCVHCGTPRPAEEPLCPTCGRPWVDSTVEDAAAATGAAAATTGDEPTADDADDDAEATDETPVGAAAAAGVAGAAATSAFSDDTGEFTFDDWTLPPEKPRSKAIWIIPIVLLIGVGVLWAMIFLDDDSSTTTTIAAETTTTTEAATTTSSSTTSTSTTTTSSTTTTTTVPYPPPAAWDPIGDPIPAEDLTLKADSIGPLEFGTDIAEIAGRLTASLGEAELSGVDGVCGPEEGYWLQWGELQATFDGYEDGSVFVSYRYEDVGLETSLGLATLSGLELGDTVATLKQIYSSFTIAFEVIDGRDHFRLLDGAELLLWGPVTSTQDDGIVEGIYSPSPCDA